MGDLSLLGRPALPRTPSLLRPGNHFVGTQQAEKRSYEVRIEIQHVDLKDSLVCGYLGIEGECFCVSCVFFVLFSWKIATMTPRLTKTLLFLDLTDTHPILTTYFEGEIIGTKHTFRTRRWGADDTVDLSHWEKFNAFRYYLRRARQRLGLYEDYTPLYDRPVAMRESNATRVDNPMTTIRRNPSLKCDKGVTPGDMLAAVDVGDVANQPYIFMRWKEQFLVPDHRVKNLTGASFEGFYYICFDQLKGDIKGYYFHPKSERYVGRRCCLMHESDLVLIRVFW